MHVEHFATKMERIAPQAWVHERQYNERDLGESMLDHGSRPTGRRLVLRASLQVSARNVMDMFTSCFRTMATALVLLLLPQPLAGQELREVPRPVAGTVAESVYRELTTAHKLVDEMRRPSAGPNPRARAFGALGQLYAAYELWDAAAASLSNARALADREFRWAYRLDRARAPVRGWPRRR